MSGVYLPEPLNVILVKRSGWAPAALDPLAGSGPPGALGVTVTSVTDSAPALGATSSESDSAAARATMTRAGANRIESSSMTNTDAEASSRRSARVPRSQTSKFQRAPGRSGRDAPSRVSLGVTGHREGAST